MPCVFVTRNVCEFYARFNKTSTYVSQLLTTPQSKHCYFFINRISQHILSCKHSRKKNGKYQIRSDFWKAYSVISQFKCYRYFIFDKFEWNLCVWLFFCVTNHVVCIDFFFFLVFNITRILRRNYIRRNFILVKPYFPHYLI